METTLIFNLPVHTLEVCQGDNKAMCTQITEDKWQIVLGNITTEELVLTVIANDKLLPNIILKTKTPGINRNNDPFGGIGL